MNIVLKPSDSRCTCAFIIYNYKNSDISTEYQLNIYCYDSNCAPTVQCTLYTKCAPGISLFLYLAWRVSHSRDGPYSCFVVSNQIWPFALLVRSVPLWIVSGQIGGSGRLSSCSSSWCWWTAIEIWSDLIKLLSSFGTRGAAQSLIFNQYCKSIQILINISNQFTSASTIILFVPYNRRLQ